MSQINKFTYVNITSKKCEGWLNLFFGEFCIAMVDDVELADKIRKEIKEMDWEPYVPTTDK